MRYLLAGGGPAAVFCAEAVRRLDSAGDITMLAPDAGRLRGRMALPEYLGGDLPKESACFRPETFCRDHKIQPISGRKLSSVYPEKSVAVLSDGSELRYDRLLLATGSHPICPEWFKEGCQGLYTFWEEEDAEKLAAHIKPGDKAVVAGGGLVGLKVAEALRKVGLEVTVLEAAGQIMPRQLDETASALASEAAAAAGVAVKTSTAVAGIGVAGQKVESVMLSNGKEIPAAHVVVCIGVKPNLRMLAHLGAETAGGVEVDCHMRTRWEGVYAAGDVAKGGVFPAGGKQIVATWQNAVKQGTAAGVNMAGGFLAYEGSIRVNTANIFGRPLAAAGETLRGPGLEEAVFYNPSSGCYRKLILREATLVGFILWGDIRRAGALLPMIGASLRDFPGKARFGGETNLL
ncbi:MAG: FAD-dependent oxidoreductase [Acidaminococcales bacterium]|jgi:NAD(P)H-nitrite reductase large subunit|nr:FAD-dependent oxidoreductase [Acidaminococcales bacterium]